MKPRLSLAALMVFAACAAAACSRGDGNQAPRASGYVEATEVRVASEVGGRLLEMKASEGARVTAGDVIARLDTADTGLALRRAEAERAQAEAQLALLRAGSRAEDVRQASAQVQSAQADVRGAQAELDAATADLERFEGLLRANAGSVKQRDDARTRRGDRCADRLPAEERRGRHRQSAGQRHHHREAAGRR
jgi:multidrug resistance efflux pump